MATRRPVVLDSGTRRELADGDDLRLGGGIIMPERGSILLGPDGDTYAVQVDANGVLTGLNNVAGGMGGNFDSPTGQPSVRAQGLAKSAWIELTRNNGTILGFTKLQNGDLIGRIGWGGRHTGVGGVTVDSRAVIDVEADGSSWDGDGDTPTRMFVRLTPDGSGTIQDVLELHGDGRALLNGYPIVNRRPDSVFPSTAYAETIPRYQATNQAILTSGIMHIASIELKKGDLVGSITFRSITTGAATITNYWFALYDGRSNPGAGATLLAQTPTTSAAWGANTTKTLALSSQQTIPGDGLYYVAIMVQATTVPTLAATVGNGTFMNQSPVQSATANTGLTTTAPSTIGTTTGAGKPWASVQP